MNQRAMQTRLRGMHTTGIVLDNLGVRIAGILQRLRDGTPLTTAEIRTIGTFFQEYREYRDLEAGDFGIVMARLAKNCG